MASVGELSVDVKARINDFSKNLNTALSQANSFADRMSTIGKKDFFAPVQDTIKGMSRDFRQIIQGIVLAQTFYTGLQGFKQLTAAVYEYTDALNYAQVTFSNLFRDMSLGEEFVAVLQQYAARSPFDFTDIEKGARQLSAYGIQAKNLMYVMEGIGNLSAVTGDPQTFETVSRAMGQIYSKGKLSAEEMRQLAEAGLNVKEVYARLGIEAGNVGKANVDAATALNTIVEVLNDTYAGAMDAANTTMRGMLANTKDVLLSVSSAVFQPAYEKLQRVLKWIQIGLDDFQKTFSTEGLTAAIEKSFGSEALNRLQQFIAICQYLGNLLYQLLAPALQIVGMYGQTFLSVFGNMVRVIGPVVEVFAALLNTFVNSAQGARLLQTALMGLVVAKMVGGFATLLTSSFALMSKTLGGVIRVAVVAAQSLTILTGAEAGAAAGAYGASAAWKYFTKTLNLNPIVLAITLILTLITAVVGLRAVLGQTTDALANMSGVDFTKFLDNIKQATGDASKFEKPFEDAGDAIDDANDDLDKTKKKLEGLLSFDEVFKLPEKTDTGKDKDTGLDDDIYEPGDFGAIEMPEVEPLDPSSLFPDITDILEWFQQQPWWKIGQYISNGIASGLKMAKKLPTKALADFLDDLLKTAGKTLDKFNIKERIAKLAQKAEEVRDAFKQVGTTLGEEVYKAIEKELGPEKAKKLKLKDRVSKIAKEAAKGEKAWRETGAKLARALEEDLAKELGPEKASRFKLSEQMEMLAEEATKAETKFAKAGKSLAKSMTKQIEKYLGPEATKELKIAENLERIATEAVAGGSAWEEGGAKAAKDWLEGLNREFAKASIKGQSAETAMVTLAKELKEAGVVVTDAGVELSDEFMTKLETGFSDKKTFGEIASEFGKSFVDAFKNLPKNISEELTKGFTPSAVFEGIKKSFTNESGESIFKAFITPIKNAITPAKIASFLKTGLKDMGITIIGEMLFDELANWLDQNGLHEASIVMGKVGPILASGLGTAIATKSPWGFVVGAIWGALFEGLGEGLENGDWSSFASSIMGALGAALSKIFKKGKGGGLLAVGSIIADLLFGSIAQGMEDNGDKAGADIVRTLGDIFSGALGGASIGMLFGPWGALAGALIGALVAALAGHWDEIVDWWNNTAVPWFQDLPNKVGAFFSDAGTWLQDRGKEIVEGIKNGAITAWQNVVTFFTVTVPNAFKGFLTDADKWLSDPKKNPLAGFWNAIKEVWNTIATFFGGIGKAILGFFTNDEDLLHDAGYDIMDGLWNGIQIPWKLISGFFTDILKNILAFFTGDDTWLEKDGEELLQGLLDGIGVIWTNIVTWFQNLPSNVVKFFINAGNWLYNAGQNIITGLKNGIVAWWTNVVTWFQNLPTNIANFFTNAGNWIYNAGQNIIIGLRNGIVTWWSNVVTWFQGLPQRVINFFSNAGNWLVTAGKNILTGFKNGVLQKWEDVKSFFGGIGDWIVQHKGPESYDLNLLVAAGKNIMAGLESGTITGFSKIQTFVNGISGKILNVFKNAGNLLVGAGKNMFSGMLSGIKTQFSAVSTFISSIPTKIKNVFANAGSWITNAGSNLFKGFYDGIKNYWQWTTSFLSNIPKYIKNYFTYAGTWIRNAGYNIIIGFYNGLTSAFKYVEDFINGIAQWIIDNKGPEEYDKKLLTPAGNWIMEGLETGLEDRFTGVLQAVQSFGPQLEQAFQTPQLSVGRTDAPTITQAPATQYGTQETQEVNNPYLNSSNEDASQRPIMYVGTLIADKQGLRELKKKLDIVEKEQSRYR